MDKILKKIIPKPVYHFLMALTGNIAYRLPGYKMTVIGVTGTDGKSTCVEMITEVLKSSGEKVGMISTVDIEVAGERRENAIGRTTIGRWGTQKLLRAMVQKGCKYAVIEASSEGIAGKRIWGIPFDGAVFTNLSPEHLNYHKTMENYRNMKGKLFKKLKSPFNFKKTKRVSVVYADDKESDYFLSFEADEKYTFGIDSRLRSSSLSDELTSESNDGNDNLVLAENIILKTDRTQYEVVYKGKKYSISTKAIGKFNVLNELTGFCVGLGYGLDMDKVIKVLENFEGTRGRAEKINEGQDFQVIIDYAVTPDALKTLYTSLREITDGKLISVFGATGDRDKEKRPKMGKVASELTDIVLLTDDETYTEGSQQIIDQVYAGVPEKLRSKVEIVPDRLDAIKKALSKAQKGDTVAITGIGHQKSRSMGGDKIKWDERKIVSDLLKNMESKNDE